MSLPMKAPLPSSPGLVLVRSPSTISSQIRSSKMRSCRWIPRPRRSKICWIRVLEEGVSPNCWRPGDCCQVPHSHLSRVCQCCGVSTTTYLPVLLCVLRGAFCRFFADILLTPLEATRIRLVSQRGYATGLVSGFARLAREGGVRELYAGFLPILCK